MKVFALVTDFPIQVCDLSYAPPPVIRTLSFSRKTFTQRLKGVQGLLQRLSVLYLFTHAKCQICVFHTEVCPDTFTRRWQRFRFYKAGYDIKPIITAVISFDCDTTDSPMPLAVLMKRIPHFIMSPFTLIPFSEIEREAIVFQRPARLFQREGLELMSFLNLRSTAKYLEKTIIRQVNPFEFLLDRLTRQGFPMWMRRAFQMRQVQTHRLVVGIGQSVLIPLTLPLMEAFMHLPHIVKQVAKTNTIRLIIKRIFVGFHGISHITLLSATKWDGRHIVKRQCFVCLPV